MSGFSSYVEESVAPPRTLVLPPSAFSTKWADAPRTSVRVGITLLSCADVETGKAAAAEESFRMFPRDEDARADAFDDLLVRWLVARGTCDPDDARRPFELWRAAPEDIAREALSLEGVKSIWNAIDQCAVETSPVREEIRDDEVAELFAISVEALAAMPASKAGRVRRLLRCALDEMRSYAEP